MALPPSPGNSHCTVTRSQQATAATACQRRRHHGSRRRPGSIPFPLVLVLLAYKPSSTSGQASSSSPTTAAPPPEAPPQAISYADYYPTPADRPNSCAEVWRSPAAAATASNTTHQPGAHIPFLGTSVARDSQLLLLRLAYSLDFPVKHFVLVVPQHAMTGQGALAHELRHLQQYPLGCAASTRIVACMHPPSVAEGWNAVFQALPDEPWGIYSARDTAWTAGSLAAVASQFAPLAAAGSADVGLVGYANLAPDAAELAQYNVLVLSRAFLNRFGLFDEAIFPAFCEDDDFLLRGAAMRPPARAVTLQGVSVVHGAAGNSEYVSGTTLLSSVPRPSELQGWMALKGSANCNYFRRKWGCVSEGDPYWIRSRHDTCAFATPFNVTAAPLWAWHTDAAQRELDRHLEVVPGVVAAETPGGGGAGQSAAGDGGSSEAGAVKRYQLVDARATLSDDNSSNGGTAVVVFEVPAHYGHWRGYHEPGERCRLSGQLGRAGALQAASVGQRQHSRYIADGGASEVGNSTAAAAANCL